MPGRRHAAERCRALTGGHGDWRGCRHAPMCGCLVLEAMEKLLSPPRPQSRPLPRSTHICIPRTSQALHGVSTARPCCLGCSEAEEPRSSPAESQGRGILSHAGLQASLSPERKVTLLLLLPGAKGIRLERSRKVPGPRGCQQLQAEAARGETGAGKVFCFSWSYFF